MKRCVFCSKNATYVIQWGPKKDQKEYCCKEHVADLLDKVPAIEFFIVKVGKT